MKAHCLNAALGASFPRKREALYNSENWSSIFALAMTIKMESRFRGNDEPKTSKAKANA